MAARKPKPVVANEAKTFDFDAFIKGFKRPEFTRNLYQAADLLPRIAELDRLITDMQQRLDQAREAQGEEKDRGIEDIDIVATLEERIDKLIVEFNDLYDRYQASAVPFTFRVMDDKDDMARLRDSLRAAGVEDLDKDASEDEAASWGENYGMHAIALTCTSHPMTVEQWYALRKTVGEPAFLSLVDAFNEAVKAAKPSPDFLQRRSPGQPKAE